MATLDQLINGPRLHNHIESVGPNGQRLIAKRATTDDKTSGWKLTNLDTDSQPILNGPSFEGVYTNKQLSVVAYFGNFTDWHPKPIDFKLVHSLDEKGTYVDQMIPRY